MCLNHFVHWPSAVFALLLRLAVRIFQNTFNAGTRWGFGTRFGVGDREAVMETTPLLKQDHSSAYQPHRNMNYLAIPHTPSALSNLHNPNLHNPPLPLAPNIGSRRSALASLQSGTLKLESSLAFMQISQSGNSSHNMNISSTERQSLRAILSPVYEDLEKLKTLTPESLPPYSPHVRAKSHAQILKHKLLPIGRFIVTYLDRVPEQGRGALELQLCRLIAMEYWPLPIEDFTHLKVQEIYRNALFKIGQHRAIISATDHHPTSPLPGHSLANPFSPTNPPSSSSANDTEMDTGGGKSPDRMHQLN
ncbi:hypothetical protein COCMIDRAFT_111295 [Bipolaris oryzae ATCC 44560]|uniref:Chromodomain-helicase-DNA-binding protein 1-like C-terminal domain-containing protein n=1 Tax=Bipolaris oryzae ATCC 44560 TaxID=930090 RepID=W6Z777_COCMI|nr:uncharacterized protein COCMIDRAFT_111295 [Bipolaris oryzae ATCC 44560]EUC39536.1 hypothetical protein COCMIDRAFT_111295 [Bipolaris oryzae ATCC 44560]